MRAALSFIRNVALLLSCSYSNDSIDVIHLAVVAAISKMNRHHIAKKKRKRRDNLSKQKQWKRRIKFKFYYSWMSLCVNPSPHFHILQHNILCLLSHFPFHAPTSLKKSILITTSVQICEAFIFLHSQNFHRQFNSLHTNFYISTLHSDAHIKLLHNYWLYDVDYVSHADFTRDIDTEFSISRNENSSLF